MKEVLVEQSKAKLEDIVHHLRRCNDLFYPPLNSYVNIENYARKLHNFSITYEAWDDNRLVGLVATYLNDKGKRNGFISNVSVEHCYQGQGIAKSLLIKVIKYAKELGFSSLVLEVETQNEAALKLYSTLGFKKKPQTLGTEKLEMEKKLDPKIIVSICCITYNHATYIKDTLDGFVAQVTNFSIEVLIYDDASTDATADIIREYQAKHPEIIKPIYQKENQYSKGVKISPKYNWPRARGKYIAMCEGDDYWTDPFKLQKQVDFLEANPEYGLVSGDVVLIDENGDLIPDNTMVLKQREKRKPTIDFFDLLEANLVNTLTVCVRAHLIKELGERVRNENLWFVFDYWFWLHVVIKSKIRVFDEKLAAYRVHERGVSRGKSFLAPRLAYVRFDSIKKYVKYKGNTKGEQKNKIVKVLLGILKRKNTTNEIRLQVLFFLIIHPKLPLYFIIRYFKNFARK